MKSNSTELFYRLIFFAATCFVIGALTSVTIGAIGHLCMLVPAFYFTYLFFQNHNRPPLSLTTKLWVALFIVDLLSIFFSWHLMKNPWHNLSKLKYFIMAFVSIFAYYFAIPVLIQRTKWLRSLLFLFLASVSLATLSGLIGLISGINPLRFKAACHLERNCGMFGMPITYGYAVGLIVVLLFGLVMNREKLKFLISEKFLILALTINAIGLYFSYTRGAILGVLISSPFYFFRRYKSLFWKSLMTGALFIAVSFVVSQKVRDLFTSSARIESNNQRISLYKAAFFAFKERPFTGYGFKNFEDHSVAIKHRNGMDADDNFGGQAHNNLLDQLATTGIIGAVLLLIFFIFWIKECYSHQEFFPELLFPVILYIFFSGQFESTLSDAENLFVITNLFAIYQAILLQGRAQKS